MKKTQITLMNKFILLVLLFGCDATIYAVETPLRLTIVLKNKKLEKVWRWTNYSRGRIYKWKGDVLSNIFGSVQQIADIPGDWRGEIVVYTGGELHIYSTVTPAADRRVCLMQDPLYRNDVTHRSMGYAHYPMTSCYLGVGTD